MWEIIAGADKGGILVRGGQDLKSLQLPERLSTGAKVDEVALIGERLHYRLVEGTGPVQGWISISLKDKPLAKRIELEQQAEKMIAQKAATEEAERQEQERLAAERAEAEKIIAQKAATEEAERQEQERLAAERAEAAQDAALVEPLAKAETERFEQNTSAAGKSQEMEQQRKEAEEAERSQKEALEVAKRAQQEKEEAERRQKEAEESANREQQKREDADRRQKVAEETAKLAQQEKEEAERRLKKAEEDAKCEQQKKEDAERGQKESEALARLAQQDRLEAESRQKKAEEDAKRFEEVATKLRESERHHREEAERQQKEAEDRERRAQDEKEEAERRQKEAEEAARREQQEKEEVERRRKEAEEIAQREQEEKARLEAERKEKELEAQRQQEAEDARRQKEEQERNDAIEKRRQEEIDKGKEEVRRRNEVEQKQQREEEERRRKEECEEYKTMTFKQLKATARNAGVTEDEIDACDDEQDTKEALIKLLKRKKEGDDAGTNGVVVLKKRSEAHLTRWQNNVEFDSGDEAEGVLSGMSRSFSLFSSVVGIGFTMALSSDPNAAGKQIAQMCRKQGGIYIKAAQTASSMQFAFTDEVLKEFESLQDQADAQDWSELEERVEKHTPGGIDHIYESVAHDAINAASIAQVHVAHRKTGEKVAVKVLRRGIQATFDKDIGNYLALLGTYESATGIQVKWMQEYIMQELKKEIDFRYEASLHEWAHDFIQSRPELRGKITVPTLHSELCTKRILVAEFIDGCKITQAPTFFPDWNRERDVPQLFDVLESWSAMQIFLRGKFHGDPHPGNILVRRKAAAVPRDETPFEIVVIDHGGYYELSPECRAAYAELWCMMDKPRDDTHRLKRKARAKEIMDAWGVQHHTRYVLEQMLGAHFGTADPLSDIKENGEARMHRYNLMIGNNKEKGPEMFKDTSKMPPELMKAQGAATFMMGIWESISLEKTSDGKKKMPGWNAPERRRGIMMKWAAQSKGVRVPP